MKTISCSRLSTDNEIHWSASKINDPHSKLNHPNVKLGCPCMKMNSQSIQFNFSWVNIIFLNWTSGVGRLNYSTCNSQFIACKQNFTRARQTAKTIIGWLLPLDNKREPNWRPPLNPFDTMHDLWSSRSFK